MPCSKALATTEQAPTIKALTNVVSTVTLFVCLLINALLSPTVQAEKKPGFSYSLNGFGTLGTVFTDEDKADFVSNWLLQPNGAGHTSEWHSGIDTKLGGQLNLQFNQKLSAVLQIVTQRGYENSWDPKVEWANLRYNVTDNFAVRIGRTVVTTFMVSDTRLVGYANPWIRGPRELYDVSPLTNLDGIDLLYSAQFDNFHSFTHITFGRTDRDIVGKGELSGRNALVLSNAIEYNEITLRLSYVYVKNTDLVQPDIETLLSGYSNLRDTLTSTPGLEDSANQANTLVKRYKINNSPAEIYSLSLRAEPGSWLFMGEWSQIDDIGLFPKTNAFYFTTGYRVNTFTPFLTLAEINADTPTDPGVSTLGMPAPLAAATTALNEGFSQMLGSFAPSQKSLTLGVRWDFSHNAAFKVQYQYVDFDPLSAGRFSNVQTDFKPGGSANVFSATIDFVF